jgi:hypothetical protein
MKNIFLYAPRESESFRRVEDYMRQLPLNSTVITLPPGSRFDSPLCLHLRSNDVIILFALDDADINELLDLREEYENFRILLIMDNEINITNNKYSHLSPRFVAYLDSNIDDATEFIANIYRKEQLNNNLQ